MRQRLRVGGGFGFRSGVWTSGMGWLGQSPVRAWSRNGSVGVRAGFIGFLGLGCKVVRGFVGAGSGLPVVREGILVLWTLGSCSSCAAIGRPVSVNLGFQDKPLPRGSRDSVTRLRFGNGLACCFGLTVLSAPQPRTRLVQRQEPAANVGHYRGRSWGSKRFWEFSAAMEVGRRGSFEY